MTDRFGKLYPQLDSVYIDGFACSANSSNVFSQPTRSLYVGGAGNVEVMMMSYDQSNTIILFSNVASGTVLPVRVQAVMGNTTATGIVGLF